MDTSMASASHCPCPAANRLRETAHLLDTISALLRGSAGSAAGALSAENEVGAGACLAFPASSSGQADGAAAPLAAPRGRAPAFTRPAAEAGRISLHPIRHREIWDLYKKLEGLHWTAQDIDLAPDRADWRRMSDDQRHFVKMQLAFFARVDIDVLGNIVDNLSGEVDCLESKFFFAAQAAQECVHAEAYTNQIEAVMEGAEREEVLNAVRTMPIIGRMRRWALRWFDREAHPLETRLVAAALTEGLMFSSSFAALQWLRSLGLLSGITLFNDYISRDEWQHTLHLCILILKYLVARATTETVHAMVAELIALLDEFIGEALPVRLIGMNDELMRQYIRFQADCILVEMGYPQMYKVPNPFRFMESLLLNDVSKPNFYEHPNTQYSSVIQAGASRFAIDDTPIDV